MSITNPCVWWFTAWLAKVMIWQCRTIHGSCLSRHGFHCSGFICGWTLPFNHDDYVLSAEVRKHRANDPKCSELGWVCIPLAVETYGNWGKEATFSRLASCIAITSSCHKSQVLGEMYGRLNFTLLRAISRGILGRCLPIKDNIELKSVLIFLL